MELSFKRYMVLQQRVALEAQKGVNKHHSEWVTVRSLAKRLRVPQDTIIDMVEGSSDLDLIVGIRCGNGVAEFGNKGDHQVEWIRED